MGMASVTHAATVQPDEDAALLKFMAELAEKRARLEQRTIRVNTLLEQSRKELEAAKTQAMTEFGTADLRELKAELDRRRAANTEAAKSFAAALEESEQSLVVLERQLGITVAS